MEEKREPKETPPVLKGFIIKNSIHKLRDNVRNIPGTRPAGEVLRDIIRRYDGTVGLRPIHYLLLKAGKVSLDVREEAKGQYADAFRELVPDIEKDLNEALSEHMVEKYWKEKQTEEKKEEPILEEEQFKDLEAKVGPGRVVRLPTGIKSGKMQEKEKSREEMVGKLDKIKTNEIPLEEGLKKSLEETLGEKPPMKEGINEKHKIIKEKLDIVRDAVRNWIAERNEKGEKATVTALHDSLENIIDEDALDELHTVLLNLGTVTKGAYEEKMRQQYAATLRAVFPRISDEPVLAISGYMAKKYGKKKLP